MSQTDQRLRHISKKLNMNNKGISPAQAGWFLRWVYKAIVAQTQKLTGKADLAESVQIAAHQPWQLFGILMMEMAQISSKALPPHLKSLASLRTSTLIGCPY